jgi:hypothetical protein
MPDTSSNASASSTPAPVAANTASPVASTPKDVAAPVVKAAVPVEDTWDVQENGQVVKKTRKEIIDAYQLRQLSDKKRSEADKTLSEYNKLFEVYKKDPIKFMRATGIDFDNLATSYLAKKAEDAMMDPKDLELRTAKAEAEQYKKWVEEQKTNMEKATKDKAISVERERIHTEIVQAIEEAKDLGMPVDEELIIAIAQKMLIQEAGKQPINAKEALPKAYASTQKWLQGMASKMEGEALVKWLGQDVALKIRKYDLGQLKSKRAASVPAPKSAVKPPTDVKAESKPYKTWSSFKADVLDKIK